MKYFMYSRAQHREQDTIAAKINKRYVDGTVLIKGAYKPFTEITSVPKNRYSDVVIVAKSEKDNLSDMTFENPKLEMR